MPLSEYTQALSEGFAPVSPSWDPGEAEMRLREELAFERKETEELGVALESLRWTMAKKDRHTAELEYGLKLTRDHAANLESLRSAQQRRIAELEGECGRLAPAVAERDALAARLGQAEAKLRQMRGTFSWRATAPLRYLRRRWLDPRVRIR